MSIQKRYDISECPDCGLYDVHPGHCPNCNTELVDVQPILLNKKLENTSVIVNPPYQLYLLHYCDEMKQQGIENDFYHYDTMNKKWTYENQLIQYCQWCGQKFDPHIIIDPFMIPKLEPIKLFPRNLKDPAELEKKLKQQYGLD